MYYEFYIDQFAAEHFLGGCLLLMITMRVLKRKVPRWRIVAGSIVQTAGMLLFVLLGNTWIALAAWVAAGITAFGVADTGPKCCRIRWNHLWSGLCAQFAVTVCFGGILRIWREMSGMQGIAGDMAALVSIGAGVIYWRRWEKNRGDFRNVTLRMEQGNLHLRALMDTGNSLREPLTGKPVSIISAKAAEKILKDGWEWEKGIFLIPYHTLGTEKAWMKGFVAASMQVEQSGRETEVKNAVLAVYEGQISSAGRYQMILHPEHADGG